MQALQTRPPIAATHGLTPEQIELLKRTIAQDTSDDELALFVNQCNRTGLDPFSNQIYAIMRFDQRANRKVMKIQVSIDGLRLIAERSGHYAGQIGPLWCGTDGTWHEVWLEKGNPAAAKVAIMRDDFREPLWGVARWSDYAQSSPMWKSMGPHMLAKCAEANALRRGFPQDTSGLYTSEEMPTEEATFEEVPDAAPKNGRPKQAPADAFIEWLAEHGISTQTADEAARDLFGTTFSDLAPEALNDVARYLKGHADLA